MMRVRDYIEDLAWVLTRKESWRHSEIQGLTERMRRMPRCYMGLHYPSYYYDGYYEPSWACSWCGKDPAYRLRDRFAIWSSEHASHLFDLYYRLKDRE